MRRNIWKRLIFWLRLSRPRLSARKTCRPRPRLSRPTSLCPRNYSRLRGQRAILIGIQGSERITAEEVARRLDTINYEITCALTPRVPRVYHRDGAPAGEAAPRLPASAVA